MYIAVGDIEGNGLTNQPSVENQQWALDWKKENGIKGKKKEITTNITELHCAVFNLLNKGYYAFIPEDFIESAKEDDRFSNLTILPKNRLPAFLNKLDKLVGHNFAKYDVPVLNSMFDLSLDHSKVIDTYSMSKTLWPDRDKDGNGWTGHGLEAWGEYFGVPKPEYEQWETFDLDMLHRCHEDVRINTLTYKHLINESKGWDWQKAIELDNKLSMIAGEMETNGMPFNTGRAKSLISEWTSILDKIYTDLRPQLSMEMDDAVGNSKVDIWRINHATGKHKNYAVTYRKLGKHKMVKGPDDPLTKPRFNEKKGETLDHLFTVNQDGYRVSSKNPIMKVRDVKGNIIAEVKKHYTEDFDKVVKGPFTPIIWNEPSISSDNKLRKQLLKLGWQPDKTREDEWTDTGLPRITVKGEPVESLNKISSETGKALAEYTVIKHRRSQLVGLVGNVRVDNRITSECNTGSTNTARCKHSKVVNIPGVGSHLGKDIRELFYSDITTEDGRPWTYINTDASGLEARMLAHVINDEETTKLICYPEKDKDGNKMDFHRLIWSSIDNFVSTRDLTKTIELICSSSKTH